MKIVIDIKNKIADNNIIYCNNLKKTINGQVIFDNLCFEIPKGAVVGINGDSGVGKTTLLHILGLLDRSYEGDLNILNTKIDINKEYNSINRDIAYIYQNNCLIKDLDIYENITLYHKMHGINISEEDVKKQIDFLKLDLKKNISYLSGGEAQRVGIARAIIQNPKILLADEITNNLDNHLKIIIIEHLLYLRDTYGMTIIFVSHDQEILNYADILLTLQK